MVETVDTFSFHEENPHTYSVPMVFICSGANGFAPYYVKYIRQPNEFDCLAYEIVCQRLARHFGIKVPDIALVNVVADSFDPAFIYMNAQHFHAGVTAFGSKAVDSNIVLTKLDTVPDKRAFNMYANPLDLIKIFLFDLQVYNVDRHEENFNLLVRKTKPAEFYAIDHFHCFGGPGHFGTFHPGLPVNHDQTIARSLFFRQMLKYIGMAQITETIDGYFYLCNTNVLEATIDEVFAFLPAGWQLSPDLSERIKAFVTNAHRLGTIREQATHMLQRLKR